MNNFEKQQHQLTKHTKRLLNDTQWDIIAIAENIATEQQFILPTENLLQIQIKNSLELPVPELRIIYRDSAFIFSYFLRLNGLKLYLNLLASRFLKQLDKIEYSGEFILTDFELKVKEQDFSVYVLTFKQIDILKLLKNVNYSTNKETLTGQESPYKIIKDINGIIGNSFDQQYVDTTRRIDFISSQNSSALEIINYCLKMRSRCKKFTIIFF